MENHAYIGIYKGIGPNYPENEQNQMKIAQNHPGATNKLPINTPERLKRCYQGKGNEMNGYICGIADNSRIDYCPLCGAELEIYYGDGTAKCKECDFHFAVIECEKEEDEL